MEKSEEYPREESSNSNSSSSSSSNMENGVSLENNIGYWCSDCNTAFPDNGSLQRWVMWLGALTVLHLFRIRGDFLLLHKSHLVETRNSDIWKP